MLFYCYSLYAEKTKNADVLKLVEILENIAFSLKVKWINNFMLKHSFGLCGLII